MKRLLVSQMNIRPVELAQNVKIANSRSGSLFTFSDSVSAFILYNVDSQVVTSNAENVSVFGIHF